MDRSATKGGVMIEVGGDEIVTTPQMERPVMGELYDDVSRDIGFCVYLETPVTGVGRLSQEGAGIGTRAARIL